MSEFVESTQRCCLSYWNRGTLAGVIFSHSEWCPNFVMLIYTCNTILAPDFIGKLCLFWRCVVQQFAKYRRFTSGKWSQQSEISTCSSVAHPFQHNKIGNSLLGKKQHNFLCFENWWLSWAKCSRMQSCMFECFALFWFLSPWVLPFNAIVFARKRYCTCDFWSGFIVRLTKLIGKF